MFTDEIQSTSGGLLVAAPFSNNYFLGDQETIYVCLELVNRKSLFFGSFRKICFVF